MIFSIIFVRWLSTTIGLMSSRVPTLLPFSLQSATSLPVFRYSGKLPEFNICTNSFVTLSLSFPDFDRMDASNPSSPIALSRLQSLTAFSTSDTENMLHFSRSIVIWSPIIGFCISTLGCWAKLQSLNLYAMRWSTISAWKCMKPSSSRIPLIGYCLFLTVVIF